MISLVVAAVLLLIHALVCLMLWTLMKLGLLPVRGHMLAVIVLVPLWGRCWWHCFRSAAPCLARG